jgi:hypothetical protein
MHGRQFRHTPEATSRLRTRQFALLPLIMFLSLLSVAPKVHAHAGTLELAQEDTDRYSALDQGSAKFKNAITLSDKRGKAARTSKEVDKD